MPGTFGNDLPPIPVRWEPRLADGRSPRSRRSDDEGMFGRKGDRAAILLSPTVEDDPAAASSVRSRTRWCMPTCSGWARNTAEHGPSFRPCCDDWHGRGLRRPALLARRSVRRCGTGSIGKRRGSPPKTPRSGSRWMRRASNGLRADRERLNQEIDRYNLMIVYPDGR
jgi:hypothetical protein